MSERRAINAREITLQILRGRNIPSRKDIWNPEPRALVSVTLGSYIGKTKSVKSHNGTVEWNETMQILQGRGERIYITLVDEPRLKRSKPIANAELSLESLRQGDPYEVPLNVIGASGEDLSHSCPSILLSASWSEPAHIASNNDSPLTAEAMTPSGTDLSTTEPDTPAQFDSTATHVADAERAISGIGLASATLVDALQATPGAIQSVQDTVDTWQPVLDQIKWVVDVVDRFAEIHPYAKIAWSILSLIPKGIVNQAARDENVRQLLTTMKDAFDLVEDAKRFAERCEGPAQQGILKKMLRQVVECSQFIQTYAEDISFARRWLKHNIGSTDSVLQQFSTSLLDLRHQFLDHAVINTEGTVFRILDIIRQLENDSRNNTLSRLAYADGACYDPKKRCLPGTRTAILDDITDWVTDPSGARIMVLFGQAGRGKSSIAHEIARRFDAMGQLCTSYIFTRGQNHNREPYRLFTTFARDLSHRCLSFAESLSTSMEGETAAWKSESYDTLFEFLFNKRMKDLTLVGPLLVVIDALDEASDASSSDGLHSFLAAHLPKLPNNFRFFITSRPEPKIQSSFEPASSISTMEIDSVARAAADADIKVYMEVTLRTPLIFNDHGEELVEKSEGLFQWAAVACAYINDGTITFTPKDRVGHILGATRGLNQLDKIYSVILDKFEMKDDPDVLNRFKSTIGLILAAVIPFSVDTLATVLRSSGLDGDVETVKATIGPMGSLLSNTNSVTDPITLLHSSFRDFLTDPNRSGQYHIDLEAAHRDLLASSLSVMNECLIFNICKLETSYLPNDDIPNLEALIENIPSYLLYACQCWGFHLLYGEVDDVILRACERFMKEKFLFWLEVLSLTKAVSLVPTVLDTLAREGISQDFEDLVRDALIFIRMNEDPITTSAPHIYLSALMFAPSSSAIFQQYQERFSPLVSALTYRQFNWSTLMNLGNTGERLALVSLSPNGQVVATTSFSRWLTLWDAATGHLIAHLYFPTFDIENIVTSPDCCHVAILQLPSYSVSIWSSRTGEMRTVVTVPTGLSCFTFSPDGSRLVTQDDTGKTSLFCVTSGKRIRQWVDDTLEPQRPQRRLFVAYSSDEQIAACHGDLSIHIWDAETGRVVRTLVTDEASCTTPIIAPRTLLAGYTPGIAAMAFSRDGSRLAASLCANSTDVIHLWNARTWQLMDMIPAPDSAHIIQIAFSPDGECIVYRDAGQTHLLSIVQRKSLAGPASALDMAFSSNGRSLITFSSEFGVVRNWDVKAGYGVNDEEKKNPLHCVSFSPSGKYVAATGRIAHVYDVQSGVRVAGNMHKQQAVHKGIVFLPGDRIVSCSVQRLMVLSAETAEIAWQSELEAGENFEGPLVTSPDGRLIVTILYSGSAKGLCCVGWNADTGERIFAPFNVNIERDEIRSIAFRADNGLPTEYSYEDQVDKVLHTPIVLKPSGLPSQWPHVLTVFAGNDRVLVSTFSNPDVLCGAFSTDGAVLNAVINDKAVYVWDSSTGESSGGPFECETPTESSPYHPFIIISIAFSPLGNRFAAVCLDGSAYVWDAKSFRLVAGPFACNQRLIRVSFSHDGRYIATATAESVLWLWNIEPEQRCSDMKDSEITITDQSPFRHLLTDGWIYGPDNELILWVPPAHRDGFHRPSAVWVRGPGINEARVDFDKMPHGTRWTDCYNG